MSPKENLSILCVDDEDGILEAYRENLGKRTITHRELEEFIAARNRRNKKLLPLQGTGQRPELAYTLFTASSGERAIEIVQSELEAGRQIAAGFFDMVMPGGIDGQETIRKVRDLDNQMLCAVVTAYADRSPDQIGILFDRQDDWLYFNKPFTSGELQQTAYHLVTAWNLRRKEEALISNLETMQNGLLSILDMVNQINRIPPLVLDHLTEAILHHFLSLLNCPDGSMSLRFEADKIIHYGKGKYAECTGEIAFPGHLREEWNFAETAMARRESAINGNLAAVPLRVGDEVLGVLLVEKSLPITQDRKLLEIYAFQSVNIIQNSMFYEKIVQRNTELNHKNQELIDLLGKLVQTEKARAYLEKMTYLDALTGLPNRRYLEQRLAEEFNRSSRFKFTLACLFIDIDHFKMINDRFGHQAGDAVLKELGKVFLAGKRLYDEVGRYGGEEFIMVLKQISPHDALMVAERFRTAVEEKVIKYEDLEIRITVSIGVAALEPKLNDTVEDLLRSADEALYEAKRQGRNRCVLSANDKIEPGMKRPG